MNWLRRLSGVSKLERRTNEEIRQELGQMITLVEGYVYKDYSCLDMWKE